MKSQSSKSENKKGRDNLPCLHVHAESLQTFYTMKTCSDKFLGVRKEKESIFVVPSHLLFSTDKIHHTMSYFLHISRSHHTFPSLVS